MEEKINYVALEILDKYLSNRTKDEIWNDVQLNKILEEIAQNGNLVAISTIKKYVEKRYYYSNPIRLHIPIKLYDKIFIESRLPYYYAKENETRLTDEEFEALQELTLKYGDFVDVATFAALGRADFNKFYKKVIENIQKYNINDIGNFLVITANKLTDAQFNELQKSLLADNDKLERNTISNLSSIDKIDTNLLEKAMANNILQVGHYTFQCWVNTLIKRGSDLSVLTQSIIDKGMYFEFAYLLKCIIAVNKKDLRKNIQKLNDAITNCKNFDYIINYVKVLKTYSEYKTKYPTKIEDALLKTGTADDIYNYLICRDNANDVNKCYRAIAEKITPDKEILVLIICYCPDRNAYLKLLDVVGNSKASNIEYYIENLVKRFPKDCTPERINKLKEKLIKKEASYYLEKLFLMPNLTGKVEMDAFKLTDEEILNLINIIEFKPSETFDILKKIEKDNSKYAKPLIENSIKYILSYIGKSRTFNRFDEYDLCIFAKELYELDSNYFDTFSQIFAKIDDLDVLDDFASYFNKNGIPSLQVDEQLYKIVKQFFDDDSAEKELSKISPHRISGCLDGGLLTRILNNSQNQNAEEIVNLAIKSKNDSAIKDLLQNGNLPDDLTLKLDEAIVNLAIKSENDSAIKDLLQNGNLPDDLTSRLEEALNQIKNKLEMNRNEQIAKVTADKKSLLKKLREFLELEDEEIANTTEPTQEDSTANLNNNDDKNVKPNSNEQ